jgi:transposase-like protein
VHYPTAVVLLVVLWRVRYKLSLRDLAEMFLARGLVVSHAAVRDWEARFAPLLTERLCAKRCGQGSTTWHADETYLRVDGRWCYLYRAIDREGNLVEALLSEKCDMAAAQRFFAQALDIAGYTPEQVTTDGHDTYPGSSARRSATASSTAPAATKTTASSKTIEASSNATTRCAGSAPSCPLRASAPVSRSSASTSAPRSARASPSR